MREVQGIKHMACYTKCISSSNLEIMSTWNPDILLLLLLLSAAAALALAFRSPIRNHHVGGKGSSKKPTVQS
jgi:hypothetical protein